MEPSPIPRSPSQRVLCSIAVCNTDATSGGGAYAYPGSAASSASADLARQTRQSTLPAPHSGTGVLASNPDPECDGQTLLPKESCSAELSSDAQPSTHRAVLEAGVDEVTRWGCAGTTLTEHQPGSGEAEGTSAEPMSLHRVSSRVAAAAMVGEEATIIEADSGLSLLPVSGVFAMASLSGLPNEVLLQILSYLDVCDLLSTSRTSHLLRSLSLAPIIHAYRLRRTRAILPPMLWSPFRPSLGDLIRRSIYLTRTTVVSRKLARSLVCIRLSRRLAARPSAEVLVARSVLPPECIPSKKTAVAPALIAKKRAIERERVKDSLRRWIERVWRGEVKERSEGVKQWEEKVGIGRVWRLRRFWERIGNGDVVENR